MDYPFKQILIMGFTKVPCGRIGKDCVHDGVQLRSQKIKVALQKS